MKFRKSEWIVINIDVFGLPFADHFILPISLSDTRTEQEPEFLNPTDAPHQMPLLMQLYASPDFRSPLDANTKVQSDKRIYAEVRKSFTPLAVFHAS